MTHTATKHDQQSTSPETEALAKFRGLIHEFDTAMMVSTGYNGHAHARPMHIVGRHREIPDDLWFVANFESDKVEELRREPRVAITMSDSKRFVSVSGWARIIVDSAKIEHMWEDTWKMWFPDGPLSPDICLIQVRPLDAEYWDQSFPQGVRVTLETVKAWITDEPVDLPEGPDYHARVRLLA